MVDEGRAVYTVSILLQLCNMKHLKAMNLNVHCLCFTCVSHCADQECQGSGFE